MEPFVALLVPLGNTTSQHTRGPKNVVPAHPGSVQNLHEDFKGDFGQLPPFTLLRPIRLVIEKWRVNISFGEGFSGQLLIEANT
jgi:hypothetical protein